MKKLVYFSLFGILGISFSSCKKDVHSIKKESAISNQKARNSTSLYEVQNNMLIISSVELFDSIIKLSDNSFVKDLINENYISYKESVSVDSLNTIKDDFLSAILNRNQAVQIGNFIYRVNKEKEKVFVLSKNKFEYYSDLVSENTGNINILEFSTEDNVFELLGEYKQELGEKALSKKCQNSNQNNNGGWFEYADYLDVNNVYDHGSDKRYKFKVHLLVRYDNWGIYRKLFTEFKHKETWFGLYDETHFTIVYQAQYRDKSGNTGYPSYFPSFSFATNPNYTATGNYDYCDNEKEIPHYRGTKCLSDYELTAWVWFRDRSTFKPRVYPAGGSLHIVSQ